MKLDRYEEEILASVEAGEWISKGAVASRNKELKNYIKNDKKRALSIRLNETDLYELKRRAIENALPYQSIIQLLVHQFVTDKIKLQVG